MTDADVLMACACTCTVTSTFLHLPVSHRLSLLQIPRKVYRQGGAAGPPLGKLRPGGHTGPPDEAFGLTLMQTSGSATETTSRHQPKHTCSRMTTSRGI